MDVLEVLNVRVLIKNLFHIGHELRVLNALVRFTVLRHLKFSGEHQGAVLLQLVDVLGQQEVLFVQAGLEVVLEELLVLVDLDVGRVDNGNHHVQEHGKHGDDVEEVNNVDDPDVRCLVERIIRVSCELSVLNLLQLSQRVEPT